MSNITGILKSAFQELAVKAWMLGYNAAMKDQEEDMWPSNLDADIFMDVAQDGVEPLIKDM